MLGGLFGSRMPTSDTELVAEFMITDRRGNASDRLYIESTKSYKTIINSKTIYLINEI